MTQKYQVKVSMKQAAIVETGIVLKQGDFGMQLEIEVLDFDATGTTPQIVFRKAMGAVESTTITVSGNKYTYTFKGTELDTPGKVFCDLKLKNSTTQRISTASFMFKVVADTMDGLAEQASSYSDTIEQMMNATLSTKAINASYTDLNQFTLMGVYTLPYGTVYAHDPVSQDQRRTLISISNQLGNPTGQIYINRDTSEIYIRSYTNGSYQEWHNSSKELFDKIKFSLDSMNEVAFDHGGLSNIDSHMVLNSLTNRMRINPFIPTQQIGICSKPGYQYQIYEYDIETYATIYKSTSWQTVPDNIYPTGNGFAVVISATDNSDMSSLTENDVFIVKKYDNIKNNFTEIEQQLINKDFNIPNTSILFENGSLTSDNGQLVYTLAARKRTRTPFYADRVIEARCESPYSLYVFTMSSTSAVDSVSGWVQSFRMFPGKYYAIVVKSSSDIGADINPYDVINIYTILGDIDKDKYSKKANMIFKGFSDYGLERDIPEANRLACSGYFEATAGEVYSIFSKSQYAIEYSISFYDKNDYATNRLSKVSWLSNNCSFVIPAGTKYFRFLARKASNEVMTVSDIDYCYVTKLSKEALPDSYEITAGFSKRSISMKYKGQLSGLQSFLIYDGNYYSLDGNGNIYVQDSEYNLIDQASISYGHGNSFQLGHNNGKGYISGWEDNTVYICDLETLTIEDTLTLPTPAGYTTVAIDDVNKIAYIFYRPDSVHTDINYDFIVWDYANDQILHSRKLQEEFYAMQGCDYYNGRIIALNGDAVNRGYRIYNTNGDCISQYVIGAVASEPEGVFIDRQTKKVYVSYVTRDLYEIE